MNAVFRAALVVCFLVLATPAFAHAPIMGIGGVFGGVLHALLVPEHGLSLVALGLVLGRQEPAARHSGMLIFVVTLTCGLVAATLAVVTVLSIGQYFIEKHFSRGSGEGRARPVLPRQT